MALARMQRAVMVGLVVVPIEQHDVVAAQERGVDDLVRRRRAVQDEVGPVRAEHAGRRLLRLERGAFVDQEVAERDHRVADVVAEDRLAHLFEEQPPGGMAHEHLTALMARTRPALVRLVVVLHQRAEERREQAVEIGLDGGEQPLLVEVPALDVGNDHAAERLQIRRRSACPDRAS